MAVRSTAIGSGRWIGSSSVVLFKENDDLRGIIAAPLGREIEVAIGATVEAHLFFYGDVCLGFALPETKSLFF